MRSICVYDMWPINFRFSATSPVEFPDIECCSLLKPRNNRMPRAEPPAKPAVVRKRNRKRKRRVVSSSSSSGSSSDSTSDGDDAPTIRRPVAAKATSSSSSSSSDSSSDSDSDAVVQPSHPVDRTLQREAAPTNQNRMRSPSVSPPPAPIPSFLPPKTTSTAQSEENEQILKDRFRKFWMASVADGFKDDLEQIRKVLIIYTLFPS